MSQKPPQPSKPVAPQHHEEELKTLLHEVWKYTIAPHQMGRVLDLKKIEADVTIVSASALPQVYARPGGVTGPGVSGLRTVADIGAVGEGGKSSTAGGKQLQTAGPTGTKMVTSSQVADSPAGTKIVGSSTRATSKSAGAMFTAAKKLASISLSRLMVLEKSVTDQVAEKNEGEEASESEYEIVRVLGEGGMGTVYQARQTSIDRPIALKMIKRNMAESQDVQAVFLAETAVTGDLEHPNIVPIHDLGVTQDGLLFYAMKQVKGTPWKTVLQSKTLAENIEILLKVCDAVAFAHSRDIIHRDLKPENVMLGEFGEVLVMDWGLAAATSDQGKVGKLTAGNAAGGTPAYMAPEMATGNIEHIGKRSDIYLVGGILYEIVTGLRPHSGKDMMGVLYNIATNVIQPTEKKGELVDIALKAMATNPGERYTAMPEFQNAIKATQKHFESITMSEKAFQRMEKAHESMEYEDYAQALFGYQEALAMWKDNKAAQDGVLACRKEYAGRAMQKEDYDLAISLIEPVEKIFGDFYVLIRQKMADREVRRKRLKLLTFASVGLVAVVLIGVTVSYFLVSQQKAIAVEAADKASQEEKKAKAEKEKAEIEEQKAKVAQAETKLALDAVETKKKEVEREKERAVANEKEATKQALIAKENAEEAKRQAEIATANETKAKIAEGAARTAAEEAKRQAQIAKAEEKKAKEALEAQQAAETAKAETERELAKVGALKEGRKVIDAAVLAAKQKQAAVKSAKPGLLEIGLSATEKLSLVLIPDTNKIGEKQDFFVMGSPIEEPQRMAEEYLHKVIVTSPFYLGKTEITNAQWVALTGKLPQGVTEQKELLNLPATNINVGELETELLPALQKYAPEGWVFRLPTEAEWEWACRGGTTAGFYSGPTPEALLKAAWFTPVSDEKSGTTTTSLVSVQPVGVLEANAFGLQDMHGNASEICGDFYNPNSYLTSAAIDPLDAQPSKYRIVRGGSWRNLPQHLRSAYRSYIHQDNRYDNVGVRIALAKKGQEFNK